MLSASLQLLCADGDWIQNVHEVDIKDEVSAAETDSDINTSTSHSTTQLSVCNDGGRVSGRRNLHSCTVCSKHVPSSGMKRHMCSHTGNLRLFGCEVCRKEFTSSYNLRKHMQVHSR